MYFRLPRLCASSAAAPRCAEPAETPSCELADIFRLAIEVGGTLSGEHGVGTLKKPYLESAVGPLAIDVMRSVRRALDPNGILNPGKVFD